MMKVFSRCVGAVGFALVGMFGPMMSAHASKDEIVLATWGGFFATTFQKTMVEEFTKATGIKVRMIPGISSSNYTNLKAQREKPQIDVIMMVDEQAVTGYKEGLLQPVSEQEVPNMAAVQPGATMRTPDGKYVYGGMFGSLYGFAYRSDLVPFEMTKWADLWDPRLKNKVAVSSPRSMSGLFLLSINRMEGGNEDDVQPALKKLRTLKDNLVVVADDGPTQVRMLAQGEAWVAAMTAGAAFKAAEEGLKIKFVLPQEGSGVLSNVIALVKGGPNPEGAKKFMNHVLSANVMKKSSDALGAPPLRNDITMSVQSYAYAFRDQKDRMVHFDTSKMITNKGSWLASWDREIAPLVAR
jgi:putative spermidine/putrescine transport system substrate-binding protein